MKDHKSYTLVHLGLLFLTTCIMFFYYSNNINLKVAWGGLQPHDYVHQNVHPENYQKNYLGTRQATHLGKSLVVKSFFLAKKWLGTEPELFVYYYMFVQCFILVAGLAFLIKEMFENYSFIPIGTLFICLSGLAGLNMSRFGGFDGVVGSLGYPLYYGFAYAFSFASIALSIRKQYVLTFLMLTLTVYTHLTMGLFATIFIGSYYLTQPKEILKVRFLVGLLLFTILSGLYAFSILQPSNVFTGGMNVDDWLKSTKMFTYHWYPVTMKMFTTRAHKEFIPILLTLLAFVISLRYFDQKSEKCRKIIVGVCACLIISVFGIFAVEVLQIPFFIKLSLQRSTYFISFFGVLFYGYYLYKRLQLGKPLYQVIALWALLSLLFNKPGISVLPLFILVFSDIKDRRISLFSLSEIQKKWAIVCWWGCAVILLLVTAGNLFFSNVMKSLWHPLQYFNIVASFDFLIKGGKGNIILLFILPIYFVFRKINNAKLVYFLNAFVPILLVILLTWNLNKKYGVYANQERAQAYLDAQLWAKENTAYNSLFIQDPTHSYAWRDFSQRSSFGTFRDWGYIGIGYDANQSRYIEGKERMLAFGVDLEKISIDEIIAYNSFPYANRYNKIIQRNFYQLDEQSWKEMSTRYAINYVVMEKQKIDNPSVLSSMKLHFDYPYENKYFIIFSL